MSVLPQPIIVPLDGSSLAQNVVPHAAKIARATGSGIEFVLVVDDDEAAANHAAEPFKSHCDSLAGKLPAGVGHMSTVLRGSPAKRILEHANERGARMIAMATRGQGGIKAAFVGSVADKVVRNANLPVFLLPGYPEDHEEAPKGPVLVGVDGSEESEQGLIAARELAANLGGVPVAIVRAYSLPATVGTEFAYYSPDLLESFETASRDYLAQIALEGEQTYLVNGNAAQAIEEVAEQVDARAVVVTTHGKGFFGRIALGSTTDRLVHSLTRPILVVPVREN